MNNTGYKKYKGVSISYNQVRALQDVERLIRNRFRKLNNKQRNEIWHNDAQKKKEKRN